MARHVDESERRICRPCCEAIGLVPNTREGALKGYKFRSQNPTICCCCKARIPVTTLKDAVKDKTLQTIPVASVRVG